MFELLGLRIALFLFILKIFLRDKYLLLKMRLLRDREIIFCHQCAKLISVV